MLVGIALRLPIASYEGQPQQPAFNAFMFDHLGAYSDVASLYFRDHLWTHPVPYLDYPFEYPVGTGLLVWAASWLGGNVWTYLLVTAALMFACGLIALELVRRFPNSKPWLLALSPVLALDVVLNWDMASVTLAAAALLFFVRSRDVLGAALLTGAIWTKFFPVVFLPIIVVLRASQQNWVSVRRILAVVLAGSLVLNLPFALDTGSDGLGLRSGWTHFFISNLHRFREVNIWNLLDGLQLSTEQITVLSSVLFVAGLAPVLLFVRREGGPRSTSNEALVFGCLAALSWFFFVNKTYSPQYGLWVMAMLALTGASLALGVAWAAVDLVYFAVSFIDLRLDSDLFFNSALIPAMVLREGLLITISVWALVRMRVTSRAPAPG